MLAIVITNFKNLVFTKLKELKASNSRYYAEGNKKADLRSYVWF